MSNENMETIDVKAESQAPVELSSGPSTEQAKAEKQQVKALLSEAENTRQMLTEFKAAVHNHGTFPGHAMLPVAKGLAFLDAILEQNKSHIRNLKERLEA